MRTRFSQRGWIARARSNLTEHEPAAEVPLRVACGSGEPQIRQNEVEKLRAVERSKRATLSSPDNQRNAGGETYAFAAKALPVALRHREQWHFTNLLLRCTRAA